jgi:hypothetical protein
MQGVSGWVDVGGMEDVRAALYESLELPTKYAKLVAQVRGRLGGLWGGLSCCLPASVWKFGGRSSRREQPPCNW